MLIPAIEPIHLYTSLVEMPPTVADLADRFLSEHVALHCKPSTLKSYKYHLASFILPVLGAYEVDKVSPVSTKMRARISFAVAQAVGMLQVRIKTNPISDTTLLKAIKILGFEGRCVPHGFRATAATILSENGFSVDAIERQLAHLEQNRVKAAYHRSEFLRQRRDMMEWWGNYLISLQ